MKSSIQEMPIRVEIPQGTSRSVEWGSMTVGAANARESFDIAPLLVGLPDDRCQCPHWGYVIKGRLRATFADHEEVYETGDLYYISPGHSVAVEGGTEYIEYSPTEELCKSQEVIDRNLEAMQGG